MRKLRELTTYASLQDLIEVVAKSLEGTDDSEIVDGATSPEVRPEGEKKFVKLHKTEKHDNRVGNKSDVFNATNIKKDTSRAGREPLPGFPPEVREEEINEGLRPKIKVSSNRSIDRIDKVGGKSYHVTGFKSGATAEKEAKKGWDKTASRFDKARSKIFGVKYVHEEEINEAAGVARAMAKGANPLIKRPKFDERGNVVLTKDAKKNIEYGKKPRSRKLTGRPYTGTKRFGEAKELDEGDPIETSGRRSKTRQARAKAGPNFPTVLVSPKGEKGGGKVSRIPKSQYDPKKHSLAEEQLDEKNWIQDAIKKPGALTRSAKRAKESTTEFAQKHKHEGGKTGQRSRLALTLKKINKEETEPLDELKKETLARYISGRASHLGVAAHMSGVAGAQNKPEEQQFQNKRFSKYHAGIKKAAERIAGTYETGKPKKFMVPGDESGKTYSAKKKKIYHGEETQLDEDLKPRKLAPQEWRIGCMSEFDERKDVRHLIEEETDKDRYLNKSYKHSRDVAKKQARDSDDEPRGGKNYYRDKIYKARTTQLRKEEALDEVITKSTPAGDVIHDFVHSKNKVFSGDSRKQRIKRALGAYYGKQRGE